MSGGIVSSMLFEWILNTCLVFSGQVILAFVLAKMLRLQHDPKNRLRVVGFLRPDAERTQALDGPGYLEAAIGQWRVQL